MPVPSSFSDIDTVAANNSPPGTETAKGNIDNYLRQAFAFAKQNYNSIAAKAASGANSDITSLSGLTTALSVAQGGTGSTTAAGARTNLGVSASGVLSTNWSVTESGGVLYFAYGGVNKAKLDSSGNLTVAGNVTAYGTV